MIRPRVALPSALALFLGAAFLASGCAPGGYYNTSQTALDSLLTTQGQMMKRITELERKVEATREGIQATRANTDSRLREVTQRLDVLDGKLEASGARVTQISGRLETIKHQLSARDSARAAQGFTVRDSTGALDPEEMYQRAYSDIAAGRYNLAREAFRTYLKHFPDTEVSDNAQYWIGEANYATGDFAGAIAEFQKVVQSYPKGDKVPAALLKIGLSYARLKNTEEANKHYRMLVQRYPKSAEAAYARERLSSK